MEGTFGPLVPNTNAIFGNQSCLVRSSANGVLLKTVNKKMWKVKVNQNGEFINAQSCIMKIIDNTMGVPMDKVEKEVSEILFNFYVY